MRRWGRLTKPVTEACIDLTGPSEVAVSSVTQAPAAPAIPLVGASAEADDSGDDWHSPLPQETNEIPETRCIPIHPRVSTAFQALARAGLKRCMPSLQPSGRRERDDVSTASPTNCDGSTLVWLRPFDLRLHDNPALWHAAQRRRPVHVVFAWSDAEDAAQGEWQTAGTAAAFWLHHAIASLSASLERRYGLRVAVRTGASIAGELLAAAREAGAEEVFTSCACEPDGPFGRETDARVRRTLESAGIKMSNFNSFLLQDIKDVRLDMGTYRGHFGTLTPFHHACMSRPPVPRPLPEPPALERPRRQLRDDGLDTLGFARMPLRRDGSVLDWGAPILEAWSISEEAALATMRSFLAPGGGLSRYEKGRHLADASAVTRISPYLRFGMLSPRLMFHEMKAAGAKEQSIVYWRRLVWRDLAYWQLNLFPKMRNVPIRAHYAGQAWNGDLGALERWQRGLTGYPLIDAGMRELWTTGWMAQNVRMAAAILLCEHLNIHWVEGERWFHHTLVDCDQAINSMMWQNAGKSGLDQWNFTMHPGSSGKSQDPKGDYVRRWCPELAKLPLKYLHTPWDAPENVLSQAGVKLGEHGSYPDRIVVDIKGASRKSGDAIREQRKRSREWINDQGYDLITLPLGATVAHDGQRFRVFTKPEYRNAGSDGGHRSDDRAPGSRREQSRSKGKGKGKSRAGYGSGGSSESHPSSGQVQTSNQSVLEQYMRASGA
eukprot:TRINITY_DN22686_c0_g1_i2.p1 TRINITY_DN22686_c0_g1~~TRINITY_DN22686_c0_g1_i2.p1  ORF type:complete len:718 (+),score=109.97 TRINITY_DN22686_c0_g1_i2:43-2196(+)